METTFQIINILEKKSHVWLVYFYAKFLRKYKFNQSDRILYFKELTRIPGTVKKINKKGKYKKIIYKDSNIYWPKECADNELPWLYEEINDPWVNNPSSYSHPKFSFKNSEWVMDCGACEGYFSLYSIQHHSKKIIAVEPFFKLFGALKLTFAGEINKGKVFIVQAALGNKTGYAYLDINKSHISENRISGKFHQGKEKIKLTNIDKIAGSLNLKKGGIIKMDIEGSEMDALKGAAVTLKKYKPCLAVAVYHQYENAIKCRNIIKRSNPDYKVEFRGMYGWSGMPRPYMLFAY